MWLKKKISGSKDAELFTACRPSWSISELPRISLKYFVSNLHVIYVSKQLSVFVFLIRSTRVLGMWCPSSNHSHVVGVCSAIHDYLRLSEHDYQISICLHAQYDLCTFCVKWFTSYACLIFDLLEIILWQWWWCFKFDGN